MLRRFAVPRLPFCNGALFYLLACCVIRWFRLRFVFWRVCLRRLSGLTAVRFGVVNGGFRCSSSKHLYVLHCSFCLTTKRTKKGKANAMLRRFAIPRLP